MTVAGNLYIVAAASGAGKTSLVKQLVERTPGVEVSISHTTRPPRADEQNGVHYHFVDLDTFRSLVEKQAFLEYAQVFDHFYGTSRELVLERLHAGVDVILEIDWQGARQVREAILNSRTIFILPPSLDALRRRLKGRGQDSDVLIERRMRDAVREISHYYEFDYIIVNDDFHLALEALRAIFIANRQLRETQVIRYYDLIQNLLS